MASSIRNKALVQLYTTCLYGGDELYSGYYKTDAILHA